MLVARAAEAAAVSDLLERARAGDGGALVITGEPGIGKSALLAHGASLAPDMRVLRAAGVEAESTLAHACLHQLLAPVIDRVGGLIEAQAQALRVALGLQAGSAADRITVAAAVLTLVSDLAGERPVLCLIDDAHWADPASLQALGFAARRLDAEPVVMLLAARDGEGQDLHALGLPRLPLVGLPPAAAAELLEGRRVLAPRVRDALVQACAGNPLALLEVPGALTEEQLAGQEPLPDLVPLPVELEQVFLERLQREPPAVRSLLLVAAAEGSGDLGTVRATGARLDLDPSALESPDVGGLLEIEGSTFRFRHPLAAAAVYNAADSAQRRRVHGALAEVLRDDLARAERRAWHLSRAAAGPDEAVARELDEAARCTLARSGPIVAASVFERAADLSPSEPERARRLLGAAGAAWAGGDAARARSLLARIERLGTTPVRIQGQYLRGLIELRSGVPRDALTLLLPAVREAVGERPEAAAGMLMAISEASFQAGLSEVTDEVVGLASRLAARGDGVDGLLARLVLAAASRPQTGGRAVEPGDLDGLEAVDDPELLVRAAGQVVALGERELARRLWVKAVARARALGSAGTLAWALQYVTLDELRRGRYAAAEAAADEGRDLAFETGQPNVACHHQAALVEIAALRGRDDQAQRLAGETLAHATAQYLTGAALITRRALAELALARGAAERAVEHLEAIREMSLAGHRGMAFYALDDMAEAAVRAGRDDWRASLGPAAKLAEAVSSPEAEAAAARTRGLLTSGDEATPHYLQAIRLYRAAGIPLEEARSELLFGEFLRRERRRVDSRAHLRTAIDIFERLGTPLWAERARTELRATGETARKRDPSTFDQLTPHELRVVQAVAQGLSNREIGSRLFISPRTVDYHMRNVFQKLAISSRAELMRLALSGLQVNVGAQTG